MLIFCNQSLGLIELYPYFGRIWNRVYTFVRTAMARPYRFPESCCQEVMTEGSHVRELLEFQGELRYYNNDSSIVIGKYSTI
jgi:hypothetical protein